MIFRRMLDVENTGFPFDWCREHYRIPCLVRTDGGTLLTVFECRQGTDWGATDVVLRRSTDEGVTWSDKQIVFSGEMRSVIHNPILFADGGTVHLLCHRNYRQAFYLKSTDEGVTWSAPREITPAYESVLDGYRWTVAAAGPGHGIVTRGGRLMIPVWLSKNLNEIYAHHPSVVTVLYSDDHGETWACGDLIPATPQMTDPNESVIAQLSDGSFLLCLRHITETHLRILARSEDGLHNWHDFRYEPQLPDCICAAGLTGDGRRLWLSNCPTEGRRNLTVSQSDDDGRTWGRKRVIADRAGYSDIFYHPATDCLYLLAERVVQDRSGMEFIRMSADMTEDETERGSSWNDRL